MNDTPAPNDMPEFKRLTVEPSETDDIYSLWRGDQYTGISTKNQELLIELAGAYNTSADLRAPVSARGEALEMVVRDHARMRQAGTALAEAALRVIREYDGTHRLALAVADWSKAIADEGDRADLQQSPAPAVDLIDTTKENQ